MKDHLMKYFLKAGKNTVPNTASLLKREIWLLLQEQNIK